MMSSNRSCNVPVGRTRAVHSNLDAENASTTTLTEFTSQHIERRQQQRGTCLFVASFHTRATVKGRGQNKRQASGSPNTSATDHRMKLRFRHQAPHG
jgi:hypothetical protein